jgi:hypothetical protein
MSDQGFYIDQTTGNQGDGLGVLIGISEPDVCVERKQNSKQNQNPVVQ